MKLLLVTIAVSGLLFSGSAYGGTKWLIRDGRYVGDRSGVILDSTSRGPSGGDSNRAAGKHRERATTPAPSPSPLPGNSSNNSQGLSFTFGESQRRSAEQLAFTTERINQNIAEQRRILDRALGVDFSNVSRPRPIPFKVIVRDGGVTTVPLRVPAIPNR